MMQTGLRIIFTLTLIFTAFFSCTTKEQVKNENDNGPVITEHEEREYNFVFIGYDINIDDPDKDRRSYYKIKIDKVEIGRTTIGLESQEKAFEYKLSNNRHLLTVEKWALNKKKKKYVKLNNIEQPKPAYKYFMQPDNGVVKIILENDPIEGETTYSVETEK